MRKIIDADWLYKKAADWEARAMRAVNQTMEYEDLTEWKRWNAILNERTAFKHDIADAPEMTDITVDELLHIINIFREEHPEIKITIDAPHNDTSCKIGDALIYESVSGDIVFDAE